MTVLPILAVKDFDAAAKFYTEKLGFTLDFGMPMPDGNMFGFVSLTPAVRLGLGTTNDDVGEVGRGVMFMIYPDNFDIDAHYELLKSRGVPINKEIKTEPWGDRTFEVRDLDGYYLVFSKVIENLSPEEANKRIYEEQAG